MKGRPVKDGDGLRRTAGWRSFPLNERPSRKGRRLCHSTQRLTRGVTPLNERPSRKGRRPVEVSHTPPVAFAPQ